MRGGVTEIKAFEAAKGSRETIARRRGQVGGGHATSPGVIMLRNSDIAPLELTAGMLQLNPKKVKTCTGEPVVYFPACCAAGGAPFAKTRSGQEAAPSQAR